MKVTPARKESTRQKNDTWYVIGDEGTEYIVHHFRSKSAHRRRWTCNCKSFTEVMLPKNELCKHILKVQQTLEGAVDVEVAQAAAR